MTMADPEKTLPVVAASAIDTDNFDNRQKLQYLLSNVDKGWQVAVEWRTTPFGIGLFASQDLQAGDVLRVGIIGRNLIEFHSVTDIEKFCQGSTSRLRYVADYLWGQPLEADERGDASKDCRRWFFGMWLPGNGLNHSTSPNTVYRPSSDGINLVALEDIHSGEELYDDYRRHGAAPDWLRDFATNHNLSLNFRGCNDFVHDD